MKVFQKKVLQVISLSDTYENVPQDPNQIKEVLTFLANELAATREMNAQLTNDVSELKTTVHRLRQEHHVISSSVGNSAQKTNAIIRKLEEQQTSHYEALLQQEQQKSELLQQEIQKIREEQKRDWHSQSEFNKRLEKSIQNPKSKWWEIFSSLFRK
jgi:DNA anti-recombination protein RmuC